MLYAYTENFKCVLQEHRIETRHGSVSVAVFGDPEKPALVTYPDVALNCMQNSTSCFTRCFPPFLWNQLLIVMHEAGPALQYLLVKSIYCHIVMDLLIVLSC